MRKREKSDSDSSGTSADYLRKLRRGLSDEKSPPLQSFNDVTAYFKDCFDETSFAPHDHGILPARGVVNVDIPLNRNKRPDMLRLSLPEDFPSEKRADDVLKILLRGQHVLAAGVSGAGKSRLGFDLARRQFGLYFDMQSSKVIQDDVQYFLKLCKKLAGYNKHLNKEKLEDREIDDPIS